MKKINIDPDCGNSPKNTFIRDFNVAFVENNTEFIINSVHENIQWIMYGESKIEGKPDFAKTIEGMMMSDNEINELTIHSIITHGKNACSNGQMIMKDGKKYAFCDVYEFLSAGKNVITKMQSYVLEDTF